MKIDRKSKVFAFCLILILFFPFISIVWGEIDIKRAIDISVASDVGARTIKDLVGKYVSLDKYDPDISYELRKDGTVLIGISSACSWKIEEGDIAIYCTYHTGSEMGKMRGRIEEEKIVWRGPFVPDIGISVKQKEAQLIKQEGKIKIWSMYTGKSSTLEFKKDGTVVWTPTLIGRWEKDRDTITIYCENNVCDKHQLRIKGDSLVGEGGMILVKQTAASNVYIDGAIEIKEQIEKRLKMLNTTKYTYLLDTDSVTSSISTTWLHLTSPIRGGNLIERYNEFFYAALDYQNMAVTALQKARLSLDGNNISTAEKYVKEADRYIKLADLSNDAAIKVFQGEVDSAAKLAEGIYKGSKASVKYGANIVLGPWGSKVADGLFLATDFAVDKSTKGLNEAAKNAIRKAVITVVFDEIKIKSLGNKTISDILTKSTTKVIVDSRLYPILDGILKNPELEKALMRILAKSAAFGVMEWSKEQVVKIIKAFQEELREIASPKVVEESRWGRFSGFENRMDTPHGYKGKIVYAQ